MAKHTKWVRFWFREGRLQTSANEPDVTVTMVPRLHTRVLLWTFRGFTRVLRKILAGV